MDLTIGKDIGKNVLSLDEVLRILKERKAEFEANYGVTSVHLPEGKTDRTAMWMLW